MAAVLDMNMISNMSVKLTSVIFMKQSQHLSGYLDVSYLIYYQTSTIFTKDLFPLAQGKLVNVYFAS